MLKKFPGFIDVHVHLRDPGATHKEDFRTGSRAAVKGGFTFIVDMPNNPIPTVSPEALDDKITRSQKIGLIPIGFHYGTDGDNMSSFSYAWNNPHVFGLKIYCNHTTGTLLVDDEKILENIVAAWNSEKPILVHAEGEKVELMIFLATKFNRKLHICHISREIEISLVRNAKKNGISVTSGVTPHHLFLPRSDTNVFKPELGIQKDQDALWEGIIDKTIDLVETDHAPHTIEEKKGSVPPFGVPGLETAGGLLFKSVHEKRLKEEDVMRLLYQNPKNIFHIPDQEKTYIELDPQQPYVIGSDGYETKCGWSPFDGWVGYGKVQTVVLQNKPIL